MRLGLAGSGDPDILRLLSSYRVRPGEGRSLPPPSDVAAVRTVEAWDRGD